ncbi:MAG: hypothetical protein Q8M97_04360 [Methanobacteriaceae archaeon]|nr:hypothetical protein [Methanobacteriaceae archaeon]MDP3486265.1 hypothetical protein [Methanobacteriaceae archaeon]
MIELIFKFNKLFPNAIEFMMKLLNEIKNPKGTIILVIHILKSEKIFIIKLKPSHGDKYGIDSPEIKLISSFCRNVFNPDGL